MTSLFRSCTNNPFVFVWLKLCPGARPRCEPDGPRARMHCFAGLQCEIEIGIERCTVGSCMISVGSRQVGKEGAFWSPLFFHFESAWRFIDHGERTQLTIRPTIEVEEETTCPTSGTEGPPIRGQHIDVHIKLLGRFSDTRLANQEPSSPTSPRRTVDAWVPCKRVGLRTRLPEREERTVVWNREEIASNSSSRKVRLAVSGAGKDPERRVREQWIVGRVLVALARVESKGTRKLSLIALTSALKVLLVPEIIFTKV